MSAYTSPDKLAVSIHEASSLLGLGRNTMLTLIHSGQIRHVRVGRRIVVPIDALREFLQNQQHDPETRDSS